jgi:hypothetical protein
MSYFQCRAADPSYSCGFVRVISSRTFANSSCRFRPRRGCPRSTTIPSVVLVGFTSGPRAGMKAVTLPSLALPMRMPGLRLRSRARLFRRSHQRRTMHPSPLAHRLPGALLLAMNPVRKFSTLRAVSDRACHEWHRPADSTRKLPG